MVKEVFAKEYPDMQSVEQNVKAAEEAGYKLLSTYTLPPDTWIDRCYDILGPRAKGLLNHPDESVRPFAAGIVREIEAFERREGSYGYLFFVLQRT